MYIEASGFSRYLSLKRLCHIHNTVCTVCRHDYAFTIAISLVSDAVIRRYNRVYRRKDIPTDVLSFCYQSKKTIDEKFYLGEILISLPTAKKQAHKLKHSVTHELEFLLVHGMLHLLGYDHTRSVDAKKMFALQSRVLKKI